MSSKLHGLVWEGCAQAGLGISRVALMARIADYSNAEGMSWPAIETLQVEIGAKSETTVKNALAELVKDGWITKIERKLGGRSLTNIYQINIEKLEAAAAEGREKIKEKRIKKKSTRCLPPGNEDKGSKIAPLNKESKGSNFEGSKIAGSVKGANIGEKGDLTPPKFDPDPSLKPDPSLNPTQNARGELVEPVVSTPVPEYPGQPGTAPANLPLLGKFPMNPDWTPSLDFRQRAAYWGHPVPDSLDVERLKAALASFVDYWGSEQKIFSQVQWEQKFARHLQNVKPSTTRGHTHAELGDYPATYNAAQRKMLDARRAQLRARGQNLDVLALDGGNLLQPLDGQKRIGTVGPMDCSDWEFDQRPDDERV